MSSENSTVDIANIVTIRALHIVKAWSSSQFPGCAREETPEGRILNSAAQPGGMQRYAVGRSEARRLL
jgi:hypothetical protein